MHGTAPTEREPAAVYVAIADLRPWARNPRKNDQAIAKVAASIKAFGFGSPVLARKANKEVIAGHTRIKAAISLGLTEVPVRYLDLDEEKSHLLAVADNKLSELAEWDDAALGAVLLDLKNQAPLIDLRLTGFGDDALMRLLAAEQAKDAAKPAPEPRPTPSPGGGTPITSPYRILPGDIEVVLAQYPDNHFDAVVCDPPYGLAFMGKRWDYDVPSIALWKHVLRVLKPGASLIAFSSSRTYHRTVVNIEDAGFEIRDQLCWLYASGMPKSADVSKAIDADLDATHLRPVKSSYKATGTAARKSSTGGTAAFGTSDADPDTSPVDPTARIYQTTGATPEAQRWDGYGSGLKPAHEPAVLARKPLDGIMAHNATRHGIGGLAIDACRIGTDGGGGNGHGSHFRNQGDTVPNRVFGANDVDTLGRWPANVLLDEQAAALLDAQSGDRPGMSGGGAHAEDYEGGMFGAIDGNESHARGDDGGASRFFFTAKASRRERELGCEHLPRRSAGEVTGRQDAYYQVFVGDVLRSTHETMHEAQEAACDIGCGAYACEEKPAGLNHPRAGAGRTSGAHNHHPTVKPVSLARYLARLVLPPSRSPADPPRRLLVPFAGSGSEVIGGLLAGWDDVTGIERDEEYVQIANARIAYAVENPDDFADDDEDDDEDEDEDDEDDDLDGDAAP